MPANNKHYLDNDGALYLVQKILTLLGGKVDKVDGKGLSTNDYTSEEKTKLSGIASGSQVNVLEGIQRNGNTVTITNKIANISVPTATSDLTNDSGFVTSSDVDTAISAAMTTVMNYKGTKATVAELPSTGNIKGDVWHVTATGGEYAWDGAEWQELGSTVDLSGYVQSSEIVAITSNEINTICS